MLEAKFRAIVSGQQQGPASALVRGALGCLEKPYASAVAIRNRRFDQGHTEVHRVDVPVISVGNLTLGGTGKTPMVKWIARWLADQGKQVALLSRGYGSKQGKENDEALELAQTLPDVPHLQNPDRVVTAKQAIADHGVDVLLLDDGFQHRRLARDLDIVLLDATAPFGFDRVFPRGLLREPVTGLRRAGVVCLTRANLIDANQRARIKQRAMQLSSEAVWCEASHEPRQLINSAGETEPLDSLAGKSVAAFCGIGNPEAFRDTLAATGCEIAAWRAFPDHHRYTTDDYRTVEHAATEANADLVVCTHKDLVKIEPAKQGRLPLQAVVVEMRFEGGEAVLCDRLSQVLSKTPAPSS